MYINLLIYRGEIISGLARKDAPTDNYDRKNLEKVGLNRWLFLTFLFYNMPCKQLYINIFYYFVKNDFHWKTLFI